MSRRIRFAALFVLLAGGAVSAGQNPTAQNPPASAAPQQPTFKVQVDYVEVDAIVTDQQGNFVRDLKKEDFTVLEDGKPQTITSFGIVDIPVERPEKPLYASAPIEPDVKNNERPFDGRVYVMVIDDLHTSFARSGRVKTAARQFIERHMGANDLMAVVHTAGPSEANQEFTDNKRLLIAAAERVIGQKLASATANKTEEFFRQQAGGAPTDEINDFEDAERAFQANASLQTLRAVADWFGGIRGRRKTLLFVSEGIDYDLRDIFNANVGHNNQAGSIINTMRDVVAAATKGNVSIYGIDPRGLAALDDDAIATFPTASNEDQSMSSKDVNKLGIGTSSLMNELRISQDSLRTLAEETGGFAVVNRNDFDNAFDRIVKDNSSYYVLAYYPPTVKPGAFHRIEVKVNRPGVTVRSRKAYSVPRSASANPNRPASAAEIATVLDALDSPLPISGLSMRVFAAPFKGIAPNASVLFGVEMRGQDLKPAPNAVLHVSYRAIDSTGKVRSGNTDSATLNLRPESLARLNANGLRYLKRIELPPGRYQLHVAAHDTSGGRVGSVTYDLDVPDFNKNPLDMSGLVLASTSGAGHVTARMDELLRDVLPGPPVGIRTFGTDEDVTVFTEVYDSQGNKPHKVSIAAMVLSDTGQAMFRSEEERSSADLGGQRGGYGYVATIPMKGLAPGGYVLKVEARSTLGPGPTAVREVPFRVVAARTPGQ